MGKKHFSEDKADRRGGRNAGGAGGFGGSRSERPGAGSGPGRSGGERSGGERGSYGARPAGGAGRPPTNGAFGRPATNGAFGRPATNGAFGGGKKFGDGEKRPYGSSYGGGQREGGSFGNKSAGGGKSFGNKEFGARDAGGFRPGGSERPRPDKEQRTGTSYGRTAERPERGSFGGSRDERGRDERSAPAPDARPIRPYQPKENWSGQPYRREGEKAVPRGVPGERNRKFQKSNPYEQGDSSEPRNSGSFGRSAAARKTRTLVPTSCA